MPVPKPPKVRDPELTLAPGAPTRQATVGITVYNNDPSQPPVTRYLPLSAFSLNGNKPVGLASSRILVAVGTEVPTRSPTGSKDDHPPTVHTTLQPLGPSTKGDFVVPQGGDVLAQTTAFYATYQVLTLAERFSQRSVNWGIDGLLIVEPYGYVSADAQHDVNAAFMFEGFSGRPVVAFGIYGQVAQQALVSASASNLEAARFAVLEAESQLARALDEKRDDRPARAELEKAKKAYAEAQTGLASTYADGGLVFTAKSREIVAHEAAHAALHALRPGFQNTSDMGGVVSEAYGDFMAFATGVDDNALLDRALKECGGDLHNSNVLSRICEEYAGLVGRPAVRDAALSSSRSDVPSLGLDDTTLTQGQNHHTVSKVLSSTHYDLWTRLVPQQDLTPGNPAVWKDLRQARDVVGRLIHLALLSVPAPPSLGAWGRALIEADKQAYGGAHLPQLEATLRDHGLLPK